MHSMNISRCHANQQTKIIISKCAPRQYIHSLGDSIGRLSHLSISSVSASNIARWSGTHKSRREWTRSGRNCFIKLCKLVSAICGIVFSYLYVLRRIALSPRRWGKGKKSFWFICVQTSVFGVIFHRAHTTPDLAKTRSAQFRFRTKWKYDRHWKFHNQLNGRYAFSLQSPQ